MRLLTDTTRNVRQRLWHAILSCPVCGLFRRVLHLVSLDTSRADQIYQLCTINISRTVAAFTAGLFLRRSGSGESCLSQLSHPTTGMGRCGCGNDFCRCLVRSDHSSAQSRHYRLGSGNLDIQTVESEEPDHYGGHSGCRVGTMGVPTENQCE